METSISASTLWGSYLIETSLALMSVKTPCSDVFLLTPACCRLYGVIISQSYTYWLHRKRDTHTFQLIILALLILEALHTTLLMYTTYVPLILYACDMPKQLKTIPSVYNISLGESDSANASRS